MIYYGGGNMVIDMNLKIIESFGDDFLLKLFAVELILGFIGLIFGYIGKKIKTEHSVITDKIFLGLFILDKFSLLSIWNLSDLSSFFIFSSLFSFFAYLLLYLPSVILFACDIICMNKHIAFNSFFLGKVYNKIGSFFFKIKQFIVDNKKQKCSYLFRFFMALCPLFLFVYMTMFFGVSESFFGNTNEWQFLFDDIILYMICSLVACVIVSGCIAFFIKTKNIVMVSCVLSVISLLMYIQNFMLNGNMFINGSHSEITLIDILLDYLNLFGWTIVLLAGLFLVVRYKSFFKILIGIDLSLILMQLTPLPVMLLDYYNEPSPLAHTAFDLDGADEFTVASKENVVVFLMDSYAGRYFENMIKLRPELAEELSDFIYFDNVSTDVCATALSLPHLFTATEIDYTKGLLDSHHVAWNNDNSVYFYNTVHDMGYDVRLYTDAIHYLGDIEDIKGKVDNISEYDMSYDCDGLGTYFELVKLSFYKYTPDVFKFLFWVSGSEAVNDHVIVNKLIPGTDEIAAGSHICYRNYDYYANISNRLNVSETIDKSLVFTHLHGMHAPWYDANEKECSSLTACDLVMDEFLTYVRFLKDNGLYDDSVIILSADHGVYPDLNYDDLSSSDFGMMNPVFLVKPKNYHGSEIQVNHSSGYLQEDVLPTILDLIGADYSCYNGRSLLSDDMPDRLRSLKLFGMSKDYPLVKKVDSFGDACTNYYVEYKYTDMDDLLDKIKRNSGEVHLIVDYWW